MALHIHWQEGLFLQPHHLQRMQKSLHDRVCDDRRLTWAYPFGVIEARLSRDELENLRIRFDRLRVITQSGIEVNFPENAELPSLDIKQAFSKGSGSFTVFLGIPLWQNARANTFAPTQQVDSRIKLLYRVAEVQCADENTGENSKPIQVRKINARLMFEQEDVSDMEVLPLLRIVRGTGEDIGVPREDPDFVPPSLVLAGSSTLRELVRNLVSQVDASRKAMVVRLTRGGFSLETMRGLQFQQMLKLRTLNRFSSRLPSLVLSPATTPFSMYLELRELLGELAALHPDQDEFDCAPYDHENPHLAFKELDRKIRRLIAEKDTESIYKVQFKDINGVLTANLEEKHFSDPNAYFLGIKSRLDPTILARYVQTPDNPNTPDKFKLMPLSLAGRAIRGIELREERHPPLELPAANDLHYFRLDRDASKRMWEQVRIEKAAAVRWTGNEIDLSDAVFTLFMTVPNPSK